MYPAAAAADDDDAAAGPACFLLTYAYDEDMALNSIVSAREESQTPLPQVSRSPCPPPGTSGHFSDYCLNHRALGGPPAYFTGKLLAEFALRARRAM